MNLQAKVRARIALLRPLAACCSDREVAILACAVEELHQNYGLDAMQRLMVIQVVLWPLKAKANSSSARTLGVSTNLTASKK